MTQQFIDINIEYPGTYCLASVGVVLVGHSSTDLQSFFLDSLREFTSRDELRIHESSSNESVEFLGIVHGGIALTSPPCHKKT